MHLTGLFKVLHSKLRTSRKLRSREVQENNNIEKQQILRIKCVFTFFYGLNITHTLSLIGLFFTFTKKK